MGTTRKLDSELSLFRGFYWDSGTETGHHLEGNSKTKESFLMSGTFLGSSTAGSMGSIPGQETKIPPAMWFGQKKNRNGDPMLQYGSQGGWGAAQADLSVRARLGPSTPPVSGGFGLLFCSSCCYSNKPRAL